jgi:hypothetical protein
MAMKPFLKRMVHKMDFAPFIHEAQRRANEVGTGESRLR